MGEVYRARDTKLNRDVARTLVLELVEGPTLADRIAQGPIPVAEALGIVRQIADALEAAHEKGIIHRDLKPANVTLTPEGAVKVLDLGLAKLVESRADLIRSADGAGPKGVASIASPMASQSPTVTTPAMTMAGVILGTAAYMSPEQARGKVVDKRADIWAFGAVLFELVTGRKAFEGEDVTETLAKVIQGEPRWDNVPMQVRRLLKKCLEKDPRKRLRDIGDAWELLDETPPTAVAAAEPRRASALPSRSGRRVPPTGNGWRTHRVSRGRARSTSVRFGRHRRVAAASGRFRTAGASILSGRVAVVSCCTGTATRSCRSPTPTTATRSSPGSRACGWRSLVGPSYSSRISSTSFGAACRFADARGVSSAHVHETVNTRL